MAARVVREILTVPRVCILMGSCLPLMLTTTSIRRIQFIAHIERAPVTKVPIRIPKLLMTRQPGTER
jgi:hypothetical protein